MKLEILERIKNNSADLFHTDEIPIIRDVSAINMLESVHTRIKIAVGQKIHNIYVKGYKSSERVKGDVRKRLNREYNALKALEEEWKDLPHIPIVKAIGCFYDLCVLLTEEVPGQPLHLIFSRGVSFLSRQTQLSELRRYCRLSGEWLASLQEVSRNIDSTTYDLKTALDETYKLASERVDNLLLSKGMSDRIFNFLNKCHSRIPENIPLSGMHSDFIPSNIMVSGGNIVVIDFECFRRGPIYRDVITFIQTLDNYLINPLVSGKMIQIFQEEFLKGYGRPINKEDLVLVRLLEIKETLSQLSNWVNSNKMNVLRMWSHRRALCRLERRLRQILIDEDVDTGVYHVCGIPWKVV